MSSRMPSSGRLVPRATDAHGRPEAVRAADSFDVAGEMRAPHYISSMQVRPFISHSFSYAPDYARILDFIEQEGFAIINRSVPEWEQLPFRGRALLNALAKRISHSSHVIVLVSEGLHRSPYVTYEIEVARELGKPIIGIYRHGEAGRPIPKSLDEGLYRMVGWRGSALARALRGEYAPDRRIFDLAEETDRRRAIQLAVGGTVAAGTLFFAGVTWSRWQQLHAELRASGIQVGPPPSDQTWGSYMVPWALAGAATGLALSALLGGRGMGLLGAGAFGATVGAGIGAGRYMQAELRRLGPLLELRLLPPGRVGQDGINLRGRSLDSVE